MQQIADSKKFSEILSECAEIRKELNEVHWKRFSRIASVFSRIFSRDKHLMKLLSDLMYYRGGWPTPTTKPRYESLGNHIGEAFTMLHAIDEDGPLQEHLRNKFGIEITVTDAKKHTLVASKPSGSGYNKYVKEAGLEGMIDYNQPADKILRTLVSECNVLQKVICGEADKIKIDGFNKAKNGAPGLEKGDFVALTQFRYRSRRATANNKPVDRLHSKADDHKIAASTFVDGLDIALKK
jgi:hypothetical protein